MRHVLVLAILIGGCGGDGGGGGNGDAGPPAIKDLVSIAVLPANQTLIIDGTTPATSPYMAIGTFKNGSTSDITSKVGFSVADPSLGQFGGATFTSGVAKGGGTDVLARAGTVTGSTGLTLTLREIHPDPLSTDLPTDPASLFGGSDDPSRAPDLVYPNDGVLVPPNLGKLEFHFHPGPGNTLFEISFSNSFTDVRVYARCTTPLSGGCIYLPDASVWTWIAESNKGTAPLTVKVRGTDDAGTSVGTSATIAMAFAHDELKGGIYYWTTSSGTGIMRFDFGSTTQTAPDLYLGTELTGGTCVGCHALSRDGTKLVAEAGGQNDGRILLLDVATKTPVVGFGAPPKSIFESWNPSGSQYVGVYGDNGAADYNLHLFDGTTAMQLGTIDVGADASHPADHPDWSPDGMHIAYTRTGIANTNQRMNQGAIEMVTDLGAGVWSPPAELVAETAGHNHYYPAFSPDGAYLAYNESTCDGGNQTSDSCNADTDPTATVFVMQAMAGATPIAMAKANAPGVADHGQTALTNSFPKWCPFVFQRTTETGSRLEWITFSSTRQYGLRSPPGSGTLIWMAAVDPDVVGAGADPSYPAFALPFQDITTSNHIAQWAEMVVGVGKP